MKAKFFTASVDINLGFVGSSFVSIQANRKSILEVCYDGWLLFTNQQLTNKPSAFKLIHDRRAKPALTLKLVVSRIGSTHVEITRVTRERRRWWLSPKVLAKLSNLRLKKGKRVGVKIVRVKRVK